MSDGKDESVNLNEVVDNPVVVDTDMSEKEKEKNKKDGKNER